MAARCAPDSWAEAGGVAAQALAIQERAGQLAQTDAEVWEVALAALERTRSADPQGDHELEQKLNRAAAAPLEIAQLGADTAELAALTSERCEPQYRADAAAAAALAAGGARAATHLVEVNLTVREGDVRLERARASDRAAWEWAERVLETIR